MFKKKIVTMVVAAVMCISALTLLSGCGKEADNSRTGSDETVNNNKTAEINDEKITGETSNPVFLDDIGGLYSVNEEIDIELMGNNGFISGHCTINDVRVTKKFEQSTEEWNDFCLDNLEIDGENITNEYSLLYIDATVENISDEYIDYNVSAICPLRVNEGELECIFELAYCSDKKSGKSAYKKTIEAGEKIDFTIGYVIEDDNIKNYDIYIDVSGKRASEGCILVEAGVL